MMTFLFDLKNLHLFECFDRSGDYRPIVSSR